MEPLCDGESDFWTFSIEPSPRGYFLGQCVGKVGNSQGAQPSLSEPFSQRIFLVFFFNLHPNLFFTYSKNSFTMEFASVEALYEAILGLMNSSVSVEFLIQFLDEAEITAPAPAPSSAAAAASPAAAASAAAAATSASAPAPATKCNKVHVAKKPVDEPCAFCKEDMGNDHQELSWCRDSCGRSVHTECMDLWWAANVKQGTFTCPNCRAEWQPEFGC